MRKVIYLAILPFMLMAETPPQEMRGKPNNEVMGMTPAEKAISAEPGVNPLTISIVKEDGSKIWLSDNSEYDINHDHRSIASGWLFNPAVVTVEHSKDGTEYPLIITNQTTKEQVRAKKVEK